MGDDAVALVAARKLRKRFGDTVDIVETSIGGFAFLDLICGYQRVLLVDAVSSGKTTPGEIREFSPRDFEQHVSFSPHYVGLSDVLKLAEKLEMSVPSEIRILAIEVADPYVIREGLSSVIGQRLPQFIQAIENVLIGWGCRVAASSAR